MTMPHERLTPREQAQVNKELIRREEADPANWRTSEGGIRYYVGPRLAGDGSIDWTGDGWPEGAGEP